MVIVVVDQYASLHASVSARLSINDGNQTAKNARQVFSKKILCLCLVLGIAATKLFS